MNCIILKFISALEQHFREEKCREGMPHKFVVSGNMNLKKAEGGGSGRRQEQGQRQRRRLVTCLKLYRKLNDATILARLFFDAEIVRSLFDIHVAGQRRILRIRSVSCTNPNPNKNFLALQFACATVARTG